MSGDERELRVAWERHLGTAAVADSWFDTVLGLHRDPARHYHGIRHVRWVVRQSRELAAATTPTLLPEQLDRVVAAAFFHDAVYDAARPDNEASSALLASRALGEIGWSPPAIEHVKTMIEATAGHATPNDLAVAVLLAADLSVLTSDAAAYGDYARTVRREYAHLDDDTWRVGRAAFITSMLDRDSIFPPALELDVWERRARANLTAELAALG